MAKTRSKPTREKHINNHQKPSHQKLPDHKPPHSWAAVVSLFTCKYLQVQHQQHQVQQQTKAKQKKEENIHSSLQKKQQNLKLAQQVDNSKKSINNNTQRINTQMMMKMKEQASVDNKETNKKKKNKNKNKKIKCSGSLCSNSTTTKVMQKPHELNIISSSSLSPEKNNKRASSTSSSSLLMMNSLSDNNYNVHEGSNRSMKTNSSILTSNNSSSSSASSSNNSLFTLASLASPNSKSGSSLRKNNMMAFSRFSGCYECKMVADPVLGMMTRDPSLRNSVCSCPHCGEIFMSAENLELHQIVKHAVSELGPEDTSKNIVEIIFQSSWLKKQTPVCKIDRILKVQNTPRTISRFEDYRDTIKSKATKYPKKLHTRCLADGNELLRFHCTTLMCSLGLNGSSNLCSSIPSCGVCSIIKNGFKLTSEISAKGILTTASSGKAHDSARLAILDDGRRAMLLCRVIAGRVKKNSSEGDLVDYDSVAGSGGSIYSNLDELYVFNPKAILPCFVVIYRGF